MFSQTTQEWVRSYGSAGNGYDEGVDILTDIYGNIYVAGNSTHNKESNIVLLKYNSSGELLWTRTYDGGYGNALVKDMDIGSDGCVCLTGYCDDNLIIPAFLTMKYNTEGNLLWAKTYSYPSYVGAISTSLDIDKDNSVYATGVLENFDSYYFTIKYSSAGDTVWTTSRYVGDYAHNPVTIDVNEIKNVYSATGDYGTVIYKFDSLGIQRGAGSHSSGNIISNKGSVLGKNALYLVGNYNMGPDPPDYYIQKFSTGVFDWYSRGYNCLGANRYDSGKAITLGIQENIFITGSSCDSLSCFISTVKFDSSLAFKWERIYRTDSNFLAGGNDILTERSGLNVYMTGSNGNYLTIKYRNANGDSLWVKQYNGEGNGIDVSNAMAMDSLGNIIVTGRSQISGNDYNIVTIKYYQSVYINPGESLIPEKFLLMQNYPNPFNPLTNINFDIPKAAQVQIKVYDINGREIQTLVNDFRKAGHYEVQFDGTDLSSGVYIYTIAAGDFVSSKRFVLLK